MTCTHRVLVVGPPCFFSVPLASEHRLLRRCDRTVQHRVESNQTRCNVSEDLHCYWDQPAYTWLSSGRATILSRSFRSIHVSPVLSLPTRHRRFTLSQSLWLTMLFRFCFLHKYLSHIREYDSWLLIYAKPVTPRLSHLS